MLYIHEIGVLPQYQRQGIGLQILNDIKNICRLTGICKFFLIKQKHNIAACSFCGKAGGEKLNNAEYYDVVYFF